MNLSELITQIGETLPSYAVIIIVLIAAFFIMSVIKRLFITYLTKLTDLSSFVFDTLLVKALNLPLSVVVFSLGISLLNYLLSYYDYASDKLSTLLANIALALIIIAIILFFNHFFTSAVSSYARKSRLVNNSEAIIQGITTAIVMGIGLLMLLSTFAPPLLPLSGSVRLPLHWHYNLRSKTFFLAYNWLSTNRFAWATILSWNPASKALSTKLAGARHGSKCFPTT